MKRRREPKLRVCAAPGRVFAHVGGRWERFTIDKTRCGEVVRVTSIQHGDIRLTTDVVVMRAQRKEFAVPIHRVRIVSPRK